MQKSIDEHLGVTSNTPAAPSESPSRESVSREMPVSITTVSQRNEVIGSSPVLEFPVSDAITRKVLDPQSAATPIPSEASSFLLDATSVVDMSTLVRSQASPRWLKVGKRLLSNRRILIPAAVFVGVATVTLGLWKRSPKPVARAASLSGEVHPPAAPPVGANDSPEPTPSKVPVPVKETSAETIRLDIQVEPSEAKLSLDENAVEGNRLLAEVPKDRIIHVLRASAPGFIPFSQIISFANDVQLNVELRRARGPVHVVARPHPQQVESKPKTDSKAKPQSSQEEEPGMNMERPAVRRTSKQIDERDPYTP